MIPTPLCQPAKRLSAILCAAGLALVLAGPAVAQVTAFKQSVAVASYGNDEIGAFYRDRNYAPLWTGQGPEQTARRAALIEALSSADLHGLPQGRYDVDALMRRMAAARTARDLGEVEVALSREFVRFARDIQTGLLTPASVDGGIVRTVERQSPDTYLRGLAEGPARDYIRGLPPRSQQYRTLLKEKLRLEALIATGGWGAKAPGGKYEPGDAGTGVVALRDRLIRMGYLQRSASPRYDSAMESAVRDFQAAHGLAEDGVAGSGTLEEINRQAGDRLKSVIVALERERWLPRDRGDRHVLVNLADFSSRIVDDGRVTFRTRSVIGKNTSDRRSPEFSDEMEHMVINPSWFVPRSIATKEYLPKLRANPNAVSHLVITDSRGRRVNRGAVDFSQFSARSFPFSMRQPPGQRNALGLVKFMFPNKYNIYLHDTPEKNLFAYEVRAFSHGCIRLAEPFEFAYALLSRQEEDPKAFFHRVLNSGQETRVDLDVHVPVHIDYRTAVAGTRGEVEYRRDVYGRDGRIWSALSAAGVVLPSVQG
ncbi:Murein L,D-transpeptidase YcbB/YkuD [Cribrihabitans marinus]|uniref:Murein L,D-transpeptidase YcbB/YkuD n=1 Tax=Cribrihabitans marinus TaxID=1227549 RepID=A0A1H7E041_9RHOB|nr:L,D-transpeptidase family protein [Cribrihabitans marinus]GGH17887.1 murein L,D-transpeptidase [Cribrihabitans marinus]SEK07024.1 Murein L,D-transpeptidase YcbB/YkuD [Cribrihabitans marinus]